VVAERWMFRGYGRRVRWVEIAQNQRKTIASSPGVSHGFLIGLTSRTTMVADCPNAKRTSVRRYTTSASISVPLRPYASQSGRSLCVLSSGCTLFSFYSDRILGVAFMATRARLKVICLAELRAWRS